MNKDEYQALLAGIDARDDLNEALKEVCREVIRQAAKEQGVAGLESSERVQFARHLLDMKESRPVIRDRIKASFHVSSRTAYRVIHEALRLCQKRRDFGTHDRHTAINEEVIS